MKQTAIEWFEYNLKDNLGNIVINQNWELLENLIQQAKEKEKQQIMEAFHDGRINEQGFFSDHYGTIIRAKCAEKYYDEKYKSE